LIDVKIYVKNKRHPMSFSSKVYNIMATVFEGEIVWLNSGQAILAAFSRLQQHSSAPP